MFEHHKNRNNLYHIESEQVWTWFESHINRNNSYHIESEHGLRQVQTCLAIFFE